MRRASYIHTCLLLAISVASAQRTTNFTFTMTITGESNSATGHAVGSGNGTLPGLGQVAISVDLTQPLDATSNTPLPPLDDYKGTISFIFNRLDSFDVSVTIPNGNGPPSTVSGNITGGRGAYQGATGQVAFTFIGMSASAPRSQALKSGAYAIAATGNVTVGGKTSAINLLNTSMVTPGSSDIFRDSNTGSAMFSPLGNATFEIIGHGGDNNTRQSVISTFKFNADD